MNIKSEIINCLLTCHLYIFIFLFVILCIFLHLWWHYDRLAIFKQQIKSITVSQAVRRHFIWHILLVCTINCRFLYLLVGWLVLLGLTAL